MKVFHNPDCLLHSPDFYFRRGHRVDHPEQAGRYHVLKNAAERAGHQITAAQSHGLEHARRVHSDRYLDFLETAWAHRAGIEPNVNYILPSHFTRLEMHRYPEGMIGRVGFHMTDLSTPLYENTFAAVKTGIDIAVSAAEEALGGGHAYGLCRPPGHHASTESTGGFCFLNNTAIAATHLREKLQCRVGVIDIDVHHGNGTQIIFYQRDDVVTVSIHADPSSFMPYFAGYAEETGAGAGQGFNLNLPLPHGSGDAVYLAAIDRAIEFTQGHGIGALVIALGLDASEHDPIGALKVTTAGFQEAGARLGQTRLPVALIQEGGYLSDILGMNLVAFLGGFEQARQGR
jgi:acetoin utilization deacetylase AcuC-like enzyme